MKLAVIFVAVLAVSGIKSLPFSGKSLQSDFEDFVNLIPLEEVSALVEEYLISDEDFGQVVDYVLGEEFKQKLESIEAEADFKNLLNYLEESGVPAYDLVNKLNGALQIDHISPVFRAESSRITGGLPGFLVDLVAILPMDEIKTLYEIKLVFSPEFAELVKRLNSDEFYGTVDKLLKNSNVEDLIEKAEEKGVDFEAILDFLETILGFEIPRPVVFTKTVREHLFDLLSLVPFDKLEALADEYMAEDEDFGEAFDYIFSSEFKNLAINVEATSEFRAILDYLEGIGIPAYEFVNKFNKFVGGIPEIEKVLRMRTISNRITGGLPGFLEDAKNLLPQEEIKKLFDEKVANFPEFAAFVEALKAAEFDGLVKAMLDNADVQKLIGIAQNKGIDFQAILDFITALFGFEFPKNF